MVDEGFVAVGSIMGSRIYVCSSESGGEVKIGSRGVTGAAAIRTTDAFPL